jgi:hypothetical protein
MHTSNTGALGIVDTFFIHSPWYILMMCMCILLFVKLTGLQNVAMGCSGVSRGGPGCSNTPLSVHFINYSLESVNDSTYDSLHDTAQLAPAPSEKTITGAASSRYMHYETELAERRVYYYTRV